MSQKNDICKEIFQRLQKENPNPKSDLVFSSPFELLIGVILSAQATDVGVNKATKKLFAVANTPHKILALGETKLKSFIKSIGLYNTKAKNIIKTCQRLIEHHDGQVPKHREALEALAGVGRKTANVVLSTAFGYPAIGVDTHVFRVANRVGFAKGKTPRAVEKVLLEKVPEAFMPYANHWLVLFGRYVCMARKPRCGSCVLYDLCQYEKKQDFI